MCTICCVVHNSLTKGRRSSSLIQGRLSHTEINPHPTYKKKSLQVFISPFSNYLAYLYPLQFHTRIHFNVSFRYLVDALTWSDFAGLLKMIQYHNAGAVPNHNIWLVHSCHLHLQTIMSGSQQVTPYLNYRTWKLNISLRCLFMMHFDSIRKPFLAADLIYSLTFASLNI